MVTFDTNVLIYACDTRDAARQAVAIDLIAKESQGLLLWQVACEFVAASRKLASQGLSPADAWGHLVELRKSYPLILPSPAVLDHARTLHTEQQWPFWDAMIVSACVEAGITRMYSEDLPGRSAPAGLQIVNPFT